MSIHNNIIGGVNDKVTPLISFYTIIDTDYGLLNLIKKEYLDSSVFETSYFDKDMKSIVRDLYNRKNINPLYLISKKDISHYILDEYYDEFQKTKLKDIYQNSISTDIINLIDIYNKSQDINVSILCYNQEQLDIINDEPLLKNNKKVLISSLREKDLNIYSQIFVKDLSELYLLPNMRLKTIYISSYSPR